MACYNSVGSFAGESIAHFDNEFQISWANGTYLESFGMELDELVGRRCYEVLSENGSPCDGCPLVKALLSGFIAHTEASTPDGKKWLLKAWPLESGNGAPSGAVMTIVENTRYRAMEEMLEESENYRKTLFENSPTAKLLIQPETGLITDCNPSATGLLGYTCEELIGLNYADLEVVQDREKVRSILEKASRQRYYDYETVLRRPGDEEFDVEVSMALVELGNASLIQTGLNDISDRKQTEMELSRSEAQYRSLVENSPDIIMEIDLDGTILFTNRIMRGVNAEDAIGTSILDYIPRDDHRRVRKALQRSMTRGRNTAYEVSVSTPSGQRWWYNRVLPIERNGNIDNFLLIIQDITDTKRAQEAASISEQQYRNLVEKLPLPVLVHLKGRISYANPRVVEMLGFTDPEDVIGRSTLDFIHPEDQQRARELIRNSDSVRTGLRNFEIRIKTLGGDILDMDIHSMQVQYEGQIGRLVVLNDLTERKRASEALRASERKYRYLTENMRDAVFMMGLDFKHTYISPSITKIRGFSTKEIMELPVEESLTPHSLKNAQELLANEIGKVQVNEDGSPRVFVFEQEEYCKDGSTVWTEVNAHFILDDDGSPIGIMGVTRDISERKKAEQEIARERASLQQVIDLNPYAIAITDAEGNVTRTNKAYRELFRSVPLAEINQLENPALVAAGYEELILKARNGEVVNFPDTRFSPKMFGEELTEGEMWVKTNTFPLIGEEGEIESHVFMYHDVTDRQKSGMEFRITESDIEEVLDSAPTPIVFFQDMKFLYGNKLWMDHVGVKKIDNVRGKDVLSIVHPDFVEEAKRDLEYLLENMGSIRKASFKFITPGKKEGWVNCIAFGVLIDGKPSHMAIVQEVDN